MSDECPAWQSDPDIGLIRPQGHRQSGSGELVYHTEVCCHIEGRNLDDFRAIDVADYPRTRECHACDAGAIARGGTADQRCPFCGAESGDDEFDANGLGDHVARKCNDVPTDGIRASAASRRRNELDAKARGGGR